MPTSLPPTQEPDNPERRSLGADGWAGMIVILGMLIVGVIYWSE